MIKLLQLVAVVALLRKSGSSPLFLDEEGDTPTTTEHDKDLYVVHAVVYEVGILTNATNSTQNSSDSTGEQMAVTFYHKNGSDVDFSKIPEPLYTNITGHVVTGLAEAAEAVAASPPESPDEKPSEVTTDTRKKRATFWNEQDDETDDSPCDTSNGSIEHDNLNNLFKREVLPSTIESTKKIPKHETFVEPAHNNNNPNNDKINNSNVLKTEYDNNNNDKISKTLTKAELNSNEWDVRKDVFTLPPESSVQSIAIPPLLSLNANLSQIPVPIPNTSILSYSSLSSHTKPANDE